MYFAVIQFHGKIDLLKPELGIDNDTGGQIIYVLQACQALAKDHHEVKIFTRLLDENCQYSIPKQEHNGVQLIRLSMHTNKYIKKEKLWPLVGNFADCCLDYFIKEKRHPDFIIANYADAGAVSLIISRILNIPFIFIPHSLGRVKLQTLLKSTESSVDDLESKYCFKKRIFHEEQIFQHARFLLISSTHEKNHQCALYDNFHATKIHVIPPGSDIPEINIQSSISFKRKPILLLARLSKTKNLVAPIDILFKSQWIRKKSQILVATTSTGLTDESYDVLREIKERCEKYKNFVEILKLESREEIFGLFIAAKKARGLYLNSALVEPFGLTALEAAAYGLPVILSNNGGTVDIIDNLDIGYLVDIHDSIDVVNKVRLLLDDQNYSTWERFSKNGMRNVRSFYSWQRWTEDLTRKFADEPKFGLPVLTMKKPEIDHTIIVVELDDILIPDDLETTKMFNRFIEKHQKNIYLVYSTKRSIESILSIVNRSNLDYPNVFICHSGAEIYTYDSVENVFVALQQWTVHLRKQKIDLPDRKCEKQILQTSREILQIQREQTHRRISIDKALDFYNTSENLTIRASRLMALRWLLSCWSVSLSRCIFCCDVNRAWEEHSEIIKWVIVNGDEVSNTESMFFPEKKYLTGALEGIEYFFRPSSSSSSSS